MSGCLQVATGCARAWSFNLRRHPFAKQRHVPVQRQTRTTRQTPVCSPIVSRSTSGASRSNNCSCRATRLFTACQPLYQRGELVYVNVTIRLIGGVPCSRYVVLASGVCRSGCQRRRALWAETRRRRAVGSRQQSARADARKLYERAKSEVMWRCKSLQTTPMRVMLQPQ